MKIDIDALAQEIRCVDGSNSLGAGALAEALMPFLSDTPANPAQVTDAMVEAASAKYREIGARCNWQHSWPSEEAFHEIITAAIGAGGQAVAVKPLDLSTVLRHAFLSGVNAARCLEFGDECDGPKLWTAYEPYEPGAYSRILSALSQPHPADERVVEALPRPDAVSMTCGTICLEYADRDERDLAFDWLEAHGAGAAQEGRNG